MPQSYGQPDRNRSSVKQLLDVLARIEITINEILLESRTQNTVTGCIIDDLAPDYFERLAKSSVECRTSASDSE